MTLTLTSAYGRTYNKAQDVVDDFNADKDFTIMNPGFHTYGNRPDFFASGVRSVKIRYGKGNAKVLVMRSDANGNWTKD